MRGVVAWKKSKILFKIFVPTLVTAGIVVAAWELLYAGPAMTVSQPSSKKVKVQPDISSAWDKDCALQTENPFVWEAATSRGFPPLESAE